MENATSRKIRIYSERKVRNGIWSVSIPIMFLWFTRLLFLDISSWKLLLTWPLMLGITIFLNSRVGWVLDHAIWIFEKDRVVRKAWGRTTTYSYRDIIKGLQKSPMKVARDSYRVPLDKGAIRFYYDTDIVRQRHLLASYRYLVKQIEEEIPGLPDMSKIMIEEMEQRRYYRKKRRNFGILVFAVSFLFPVVRNSAVEPAIFLIAAIAIGSQYLSLWEIFRGIYFGRKTEKKIEKRFANYPSINLYLQKISYYYLLVIGILTAGVNVFWIWF